MDDKMTKHRKEYRRIYRDNFGEETISQGGRGVGGMVSNRLYFWIFFFYFLFNFYFYPPNPPNIYFMIRKY